MASATIGRLVIVSGAPGAGKSTVSSALALAWPAPATLRIHADDLWGAFAKGFIPPWTPESAGQNAAVTKALAVQGATLAEAFPVFLDGVVGPWFVEPFREAARRCGVRLDYVVLRPSREAAVGRGVAREGHPMRDAAVIGQMWDQFAELGALEGHAVDTTNLTPEQTVGRLLDEIAAGRFLLA